MKKTKKITISAMLSALSCVLLWLGGLVEILDVSVAVLASFGVVFVQIELRGYWPYLVWIATSTLSLLLFPAKTAALYYAAFCGLYAILKNYIEKLPKVFSWILKFAVFNLLFALICFITVKFLTPDYEPQTWLALSLIGLGNIAFLCYDVVITLCVRMYFIKIRPRILKFLK